MVFTGRDHGPVVQICLALAQNFTFYTFLAVLLAAMDGHDPGSIAAFFLLLALVLMLLVAAFFKKDAWTIPKFILLYIASAVVIVLIWIVNFGTIEPIYKIRFTMIVIGIFSWFRLSLNVSRRGYVPHNFRVTVAYLPLWVLAVFLYGVLNNLTTQGPTGDVDLRFAEGADRVIVIESHDPNRTIDWYPREIELLKDGRLDKIVIRVVVFGNMVEADYYDATIVRGRECRYDPQNGFYVSRDVNESGMCLQIARSSAPDRGIQIVMYYMDEFGYFFRRHDHRTFGYSAKVRQVGGNPAEARFVSSIPLNDEFYLGTIVSKRKYWSSIQSERSAPVIYTAFDYGKEVSRSEILDKIYGPPKK